MPKLNQVLAAEQTIKGKAKKAVDEAYHTLQKASLFDGFTKTYKKSKDTEEDLPKQSKRVEYTVEQLVADIAKHSAQMFDVEAQKDVANMAAKASVELEGKTTPLGPWPVTFLLFLEKALTDFHTAAMNAPTLDPAEEWKLDTVRGIHHTDATSAARTKKVQKGLVLYPATDKHPAQTQLITEDEIVGMWEQVKLSGAWTEARKRQVVERTEAFLKAVKYAREQANVIDAPEQLVGKQIFDWLLRG